MRAVPGGPPHAVPGSEHAKGEEETLYKARKAAVTGKLRVRGQPQARRLGAGARGRGAYDAPPRLLRPPLCLSPQIKFMNARNIAPPHRKLDLRCVVKVDSVVRARTTVKTKTNLPEWNEDFEVRRAMRPRPAGHRRAP